MDFFNGELSTKGIAKEMQEEVDRVKKKEEWRVEYMTMMELEREKYREGLERGIEQGISQGKLEGSIATLYELGYFVSEIAKRLNQKEEKVLEILNLPD